MTPIIVIVGRPNVGKSTLFNRLSRSNRAMVDDLPGITRDRLFASINYDGVPLTIIDTGGLDESHTDQLLKEVRSQVDRAIEDADVIIFMVDGQQGLMPGDKEVADILRRREKSIVLAVNKIHGPEHDHLISEFYPCGIDAMYPISAAHGYGIRALMQHIIQNLPASEPDIDDGEQVRVAVLGRPNVGKSSLINRILGSERLVVSDLPGTTRDPVDTPFEFGGKSYLLIDTAGIRRKGRVKEKIDRFSMINAIKSLDRCHIAVILVDAYEGIFEQDARICGYAFERGRGIVLAVNKWDLIKVNDEKQNMLNSAIDRQLPFISFAPRINVSALTGRRVMSLFKKIDMVYEHFSYRASTSAVNTALGQMIEKHPPPRTGRGSLRFLFATQVRFRPPTFVVFVNRPDWVHFSYKRFLINQLRIHFKLDHTPIVIKFKKR